MKIPFNDLQRLDPALKSIISEDILQIINKSYYLLGDFTSKFEVEFARYCNSSFCVTVANGTDALEIALRAAGCTTGSEVITVSNAGNYTTTACHLCGAIPIYVDVNPYTLGMNIDHALDAITSLTQAIVVTHLYGIPVNVEELKTRLHAIGRSDIYVVEDCAQAHGAKVNNKVVGSLGDLSCFSFYPTKNLGAFGDAGAITCNDPEMYEKIKKLRQYGWSKKYVSSISLSRNSRMDEIQAAVLLRKLPYLNAWNIRRNEILNFYQSMCKNNRILGSSFEGSVSHLCVILTNDRKSAISHLLNSGVATDVHYPLLDFDQPCYQSDKSSHSQAKFKLFGDLENSRLYIKQILSIPCFPEMLDSEVEYIGNILKSFDMSDASD